MGNVGISQVKVFADGIPRSRTAWMSQPYDDCTHGHLQVAGNTDDERIAEVHAIVSAAASRGWQVGLHTIGDLAISHVLDAVTMPGNRVEDLRHYIIHGDFVTVDDLMRMANSGVTLNANPSIRWAVGGSVAPILGEDRNNQRQRLRTAWDLGVNVCGSSDAPIASPDWRYIVAAAMTRSWRSDATRTDDQRLSAKEAIQAVTSNAAWQSHAETWRGSLRVGHAADLVVMANRVNWQEPWSLIDTSVRATFVGGECVFGDWMGEK
jgi:predicted amidohydrolase YtcJ